MEEYTEDGRRNESAIVCITDFSPSSNLALRWSVAMAEKIKAHLTVLHTFRLLHTNGLGMQMKLRQEEQANKDFSVIEKSLLMGHPITYEFKTEVGFIADRIEDLERKNPIDLIVLSEKIRENNKEIFDELLQRIKMPLTIIP